MSPEPDSNVVEGSGSNAKTLIVARLASLKKAEEAGNSRFFEAAAWVKTMVGSLDIPCDPPSEEEFRLCLRNGIILCNLLNKVQPGSVAKVVANHVSAYQYFENVKNFLAALVQMKLPTFEASLLEKESWQPGSTTKIVDCILALKGYYECKQQRGGNATTNCVPVILPNPSITNVQEDGGEKTLDDIFQSNGLIGVLKAEEAGNIRFFEAAAWVKSMVGSLDIPCDPPSEDEFRLCLRNGIILCNLLNKVQPGAVSNVVANHGSAYQYFENVKNFLVALVQMKLPTFEASLLEQESSQPGSTKNIVDCILALKGYYERKQQCRGNARGAETISTLKSAERVASVELGAAPLNKESGEVRELKEQVDSLKKALARKEVELAQLHNIKMKMKESPYQLHTPVRTRILSLEGSVISKAEVQNGNCNCGMVSEDDKLVDYGENNGILVGKQNGNGNRPTSLGNERRNLSVVKSGTEAETNTNRDTGTETTSATKKTSQIKKSPLFFGKLYKTGHVRA